MKRSPLLPLALVLVALPVAVRAQDTAPAPVVTAPLVTAPIKAAIEPPAPNQVIINSPAGGTSSFNNETGVGIVTKDVTVTQTGEDFILYAQRVVYSRPKNVATATQDLRVESRDSTIRAVRMFGDFNTKVLSMTGDVVISSYGKGDGVQTAGAIARRAKEGRKPVRISCDRLDWNYDTRQANLVGNLRIVQGDYSGTCNQIIYDEPKNAAHLLGDVRFGNTKNQQFLGEDLVLYIDKDLVQTNQGVIMRGDVNTLAEGETPPAPKTAIEIPEAGALPDDSELPAPPPDINNFLGDRKPGANKAKKPAPAPKPAAPPEKTPEKTPPAQP